jgi:hypothetical protein
MYAPTKSLLMAGKFDLAKKAPGRIFGASTGFFIAP